MSAAVAGLGIAHLPAYVAQPAIKEGRLIPVLTEFMIPLGKLSLIWPTNKLLSPKVRIFIDFYKRKS